MNDSESSLARRLAAKFKRLLNFKTDLDSNLGHSYKI